MNVLLASAIPFFLMTAPAFSDSDPRKILDGVYQQDTSHDTAMRAVFDIFDRDGHKTTKKFMLSAWARPAIARRLCASPIPLRFVGYPAFL